MSEYLKDYDINDQIVFDQVFLVGTNDYTAIGRPTLGDAKVKQFKLGVCNSGVTMFDRKSYSFQKKKKTRI